MTKLLLVGSGGHGRVLADLAEIIGFDSIAFVDKRWPEVTWNQNWPVIGGPGDLGRLRHSFNTALASVGDNAIRLSLHRRLVDLSFEVPTLCHPSSTVSRYAKIGCGSVVLAQASVSAFATVGESVILNTACTVDHDCVVGDGAHVSPGAHLAGNVRVGRGAWIGIGAAIREGTAIGEGAMVGAGSTVVANVEDGVTVIGAPARPQKTG